MKFHELTNVASRKGKRVGRGISAGGGKTAGRGTKGQNSRSGGGVRPGFEGGQNPLMQRLPKLRGFTSHRPSTQEVYTGDLSQFAGKTVDNHTLKEAGLITNAYLVTKVIARGELKGKVILNIQRASAAALSQIEAAGGSFNVTELPKRPVTSTKTKKSKE